MPKIREKGGDGRRIKCFGLTGGIASGKSLVAEYLREAGVVVLNLDEIGREVTDMNQALQKEIEKICGVPIIDEKGVLDRGRIREVIFKQPKKRREIERLLHPAILANFEQECEALKQSGHTFIVCEAALLIESGYHKNLDGLIVVTSSSVARKKRLVARDSISAELADKMIASQVSDQERLRLATVVIENQGQKMNLRAKVRALVQSWQKELGSSPHWH